MTSTGDSKSLHEAYKAQLISGKANHVAKAMQAAVANMSGLKLNVCVVETRVLPPVAAAPFFSTLSTIMANNLRKLAVQCSMNGRLEGLEELAIALEFQAYESMDGLVCDQEYIVAGLAALLNGLAPSLSALSISHFSSKPSGCSLLSPTSDLLSDPTTLVRFLRNQSQQLRTVELHPQFMS